MLEKILEKNFEELNSEQREVIGKYNEYKKERYKMMEYRKDEYDLIQPVMDHIAHNYAVSKLKKFYE